MIVVPSFLEKPSNYFEIRVAPKGIVDVLRDPRVLATFAARVVRESVPRTISDRPTEKSDTVKKEADESGLPASDVGAALHHWATTRTSAEDKPIASLFAGDYEGAVRQLDEAKSGDAKGASLRLQRADKAFFTAIAYYGRGDYSKAVEVLEANSGVPDSEILNFLGVCLYKSGRTREADAAWRGAAGLIQLRENTRANFNLAESLYKKGIYSEAELLYEQVLNGAQTTGTGEQELITKARERIRQIDASKNLTPRPPTAAAPRFKKRIYLVLLIGLVFFLLTLAWVIYRLTRSIGRAARMEPERRVRDWLDYRGRSENENLRLHYRYFGADYSWKTKEHRRSEKPAYLAKSASGSPRAGKLGIAFFILAVVIGTISFWSIRGRKFSLGPSVGLRTADLTQVRVHAPGSSHSAQCWSTITAEPSVADGFWKFSLLMARDARPFEVSFFVTDPIASRVGKSTVVLEPGSSQTVEVEMRPGTSLVAFRGVVEGLHRLPIQNATVRVIGGGDLSVRTGHEGEFSFDLTKETTKSLAVAASAPGYKTAVALRPQGDEDLVISLHPTER